MIYRKRNFHNSKVSSPSRLFLFIGFPLRKKCGANLKNCYSEICMVIFNKVYIIVCSCFKKNVNC